jgi:hypothetical protein
VQASSPSSNESVVVPIAWDSTLAAVECTNTPQWLHPPPPSPVLSTSSKPFLHASSTLSHQQLEGCSVVPRLHLGSNLVAPI